MKRLLLVLLLIVLPIAFLPACKDNTDQPPATAPKPPNRLMKPVGTQK